MDFRYGNDSEYYTVQLAILVGYKELYFCGIELNVVDNFLSRIIEYLKNGIKLISCSPVSRLNKVIEYHPLTFVIGD